ncbi:MAG: mechanosensitive ion channel family protein [Lentisphaerae bacterium]|nr:mechanosensitive ion channel family protein [Lentisphaerota bacterium]MCP4103684.1 mechanosensitive ion channel family protein [Lentisphaerota bacterium]
MGQTSFKKIFGVVFASAILSVTAMGVPPKSGKPDPKLDAKKVEVGGKAGKQLVINIDKLVVNEKEKESGSLIKGGDSIIKTDGGIDDISTLKRTLKKSYDSVIGWFIKHRTNILILFGGVVATLFAVYFFKRIFTRVIMARYAAKTKTKLDDHICSAIVKPASLFIFTLGFFLSSFNILRTLKGEFFEIILRCFVALLVASVVWAVYRMINVMDYAFREMTSKTENSMDDLLVDLIRKAMKITVAVVSVLFIGQSILGLNITALVAGAGVIGLAIAFAAKDTIANFFGSIMIILDKPFAIGERVLIDGIDGIVEKVGFRSTRIRSLKGHMFSVPNNKVADSVVENVTKRPYIKYPFDLTVTYDTSPVKMERALAILHEILDNHEAFNEEMPARIYFTAFNDWALNINIILWFQTTAYFEAQQWKHDINMEILRRFNAEGIDFAFPTSTNYLVSDPDRELKLTAENPTQENKPAST